MGILMNFPSRSVQKCSPSSKTSADTGSMRQIRGKLWELRISRTRIFYVVVVGDTMVLLHAYKKQGQKAPTREIETATRRMAEVLEGRRT